MDITPNATTVVQIINFGIAYGMIRVFLCKPVVALLQQEQEHLDQLRSAITAHTNLVASTKDDLYNQWNLKHQFFINNRPVLDYTMSSIHTVPVTEAAVTPGQQEIDALEEKLVNSLMRRVLHGNK
jgi:hypothetical protein